MRGIDGSKVDEYDSDLDGWHRTDAEAWSDIADAMRDLPQLIEEERPVVWRVLDSQIKAVPVWTDGEQTWVAAADAAFADGVESCEPIDAYRVLVRFASGDTAELLNGERLYVQADET